MPSTSESADLADRFRRGDRTALREVHHRYAGAMFVIAFHMLADHDLAMDAVQQAFVQAWRAAGSVDRERELKPWLYAITRRAAIDAYRRERRHSQQLNLDDLFDGDAGLLVDGPSLDDVWKVWQVRKALAALPTDERHVLLLAYFADRSHTEIAALLGIALGTVKSRAARAQRRLAGMLPHLRPEPTVSA